MRPVYRVDDFFPEISGEIPVPGIQTAKKPFARASRFMNCPICEKPTTWKDNPFRPFCSEKCQDRDLGNWLTESYSVPDETNSEEGESWESGVSRES